MIEYLREVIAARDKAMTFDHKGHRMIDLWEDGFICTCGEKLYPDCDISAASVANCFYEHLDTLGVYPD